GAVSLLGVPPLLGRGFSHADDSPGSPETVILTAGFWRSKLGGDPAAVGRRLVLDGRPREIIGVMPDAYRFLDRKPALFLPLRLDPNKTILGNFSFSALARLKPGVPIQQASADVARMIPIAIHRFPPFPGFTAKAFEEARVEPRLRPLKEDLVGDISAMLWVLMGT